MAHFRRVMPYLLTGEHFERNQESDDTGTCRRKKDEQHDNRECKNDHCYLSSGRKPFEEFDKVF